MDQITEAAFVTSDGDQFHGFIKHDRLPCDWVLDKTDYVQRVMGAGKVSVLSMLLRLKYMCDGETYLVGANPTFDHSFLRREFHAEGLEVPYHHRLICVENLVMGAFGLTKPPALKECRGILGIPGKNEAPHTALADALEAKLVFETLQKQFNSEAA